MSKHTHERDAAKDRGKEAEGTPKDAQVSGAEKPEQGPDDSAAGENPAAGEGGKEISPLERISLLEAQLAGANDQYLRKAADFENYRKRMIREKQEAIDYANQALLMDLIHVMDDFDRAIKAAEACFPREGQGAPVDEKAAPAMFKTFYEGVSMIEKRLSTELENKWGLKRFDSAGQPFDPNRHEAIMMEKSAEISEPLVNEEFYKGYTLKERVVRAAKVKVSMPLAAGDSGSAPDTGAGASSTPAGV